MCGQTAARYARQARANARPAVRAPLTPADTSGMKRAWWLYALAGLAVTLLYAFGPSWFGAAPVLNAIGASSVVAIVAGVYIWKPTKRLAWYLMALGLALFVAGDVITYNYERLFHSPLPFPSVGDVLYLAVYPCLMAGILVLVAARNPKRDGGSLIDSLIIATGFGAFSWVFIMSHLWHQAAGTSVLVHTVSIAYPTMDLLLLAVIVRMALGAGRRTASFYLLLSSVMFLLVADTWYSLVLVGAPDPSPVLDIAWACFYILWGAAALHPSMRSMEDRAAHAPVSNRARRALLLVAALSTPCLQLIQTLRGQSIASPVAAAASILLIILVFARLNDLFVDIAEHRKTEEGLEQAKARYQAIVRNVPAIVYTVVVEPAGPVRTSFVSQRIVSILGYTVEEFLRDHSRWQRIAEKEDRRILRDRDAGFQRKGDPFRGEYRMLTRDGEVRWFRDEAILVEPGTPAEWQGVMLDVTDERLAREDLRRAEELYRTVVEQIPAITYLDVVRKETSSSYPTVYISPQVERVLGVTPQEWIEDPALWLHLLHPEDRERMIDADVQTNLNGQPFSQEYRMVARDGRTVWIKDDAVMIRDERSGDQFWHGVMQDVTAAKAAEGALRKALEREREAAEHLQAVDEMKNAFLSAVSHELRTPLTVLIGTSDTLARHSDTLSREEIQSFGTGLYAKAKELDRLLSDLLDLERLRTGTTTITATPADLEALANAVVANSGVARTHPVDVAVSCPIVWVDVFKIERILHNLLVNASKHTSGGTQVWVRIAETAEGVLIQVDDAGRGVPPELQSSLFEPFRRGDLHAPTGAGIGLSIVAKFAELHGGRAWVTDRQGGGASFSVLVRPQPPESGPTAEERPAARTKRGGTRRPNEVIGALDGTAD
jgi:PAS domain S-box-containing protein